jgi:hypothetical protein
MEIEEYNQSIVKAQKEEEKAQEDQTIIQRKLYKSNADADSIALVELETNNSIFELMEKIDQSSRPVSPFILKRINWKHVRLIFRYNDRDKHKKYLNKIAKKVSFSHSGLLFERIWKISLMKEIALIFYLKSKISNAC